MELVHALQKLTSQQHLMEFATVLPVDHTAAFVLMSLHAQPACHPSQRQLIINVSAQSKIMLRRTANVFHAQLDVKLALLLRAVADVLSHLFFKGQFVKPTVMMDLPLLAQSANPAQPDACNALKILSASTAPTDCTCIMEPATAFALLERLEIVHQAVGVVSHVTLPV